MIRTYLFLGMTLFAAGDRNRNGGGVCFYIRSAISYSLRPDLLVGQLENLTLSHLWLPLGIGHPILILVSLPIFNHSSVGLIFKASNFIKWVI